MISAVRYEKDLVEALKTGHGVRPWPEGHEPGVEAALTRSDRGHDLFTQYQTYLDWSVEENGFQSRSLNLAGAPAFATYVQLVRASVLIALIASLAAATVSAVYLALDLPRAVLAGAMAVIFASGALFFRALYRVNLVHKWVDKTYIVNPVYVAVAFIVCLGFFVECLLLMIAFLVAA